MEINIETIKQLIELVVENKLDVLKLGDLEISKSRHDNIKVSENQNKIVLKGEIVDPDELMFYSSSARHNNAEEANTHVINPYLSPKTRNQE